MTIRVLAIGGSLRKGSFNKMLVEQVRRQAPEGMLIEIADISDVPLYNGDVQTGGFPQAVQRLSEQVSNADAFFIATPEYNYSVPGVLKNTLDWLSRNPEARFQGKPLAIASASMGKLGGARAQHHLRQVLIYMDVDMVNKPELTIAAAHEKFSDKGELLDLQAREILDNLLASLMAKTLRNKSLELDSQAA